MWVQVFRVNSVVACCLPITAFLLERQGAFKAYRARREEEGQSMYEARWKAIFALQKLIDRARDAAHGGGLVRLAGGDRCVCF